MDVAKTKRPEFSLICRLCIKLLESEKVSPIFNNEIYAERVTLPERIRYCSSVEVNEGDGLPDNICTSCLLKLNQSFVFRNQCVLADNTLKKLVQNEAISMTDADRFLNVDIESQIIQMEKVSLKESVNSFIAGALDSRKGVSENVTNNGSIDEFDNSKNGRHKRNINKSNDRSLQKANICKSNMSEMGDLSETYELESGKSCRTTVDRSSKLKIKKNKKNENKSTDSSCSTAVAGGDANKGRRTRKARAGKSYAEPADVKEEMTEEIDDNLKDFENFTVEPDVFDLGHGNKEPDGAREEKLRTDHGKKIRKEKSCGIRKHKPRKYSAAKEKPSSYTCDYCHKVYPSEGGWRYHIHTMHNENYQPFICDLCGKAFKVKKNLEGHKNSIHYHLKHHLCDLCGRGFASKYALKVHKIWHNDEKNFPCDICGTKFRTRGKMNTHRSIHGGPKKFMCHVCSRDFRWKKDFEIHMRTHTGEKPFKCSHCGKAFSSLTNMKKHERNHTGKPRSNADQTDADEFEAAVREMDGHRQIVYKAESPFRQEPAVEGNRSQQFR